jgi:HD-like signal output (HDOD) protein
MQVATQPQNWHQATNAMGSSPELIEVQLASEKIARDLKLPPCPELVNEFSKAMADENVDIRDVATMVGKDLALSASILKTVNSPYFGRRTQTTNMSQAVSIIGLQNTACLVSRLLIRQAFGTKAGRLMEDFWNDTARYSTIADKIAPEIRAIDPEEAKTYITFRNAGQAVLINRFDNYGDLLLEHHGALGLGLIQQEKERFELTHNQLGYVLAKEWHLPEMLALAIFFHHDAKYFNGEAAASARMIKRLIAFGFLVDQIDALQSGGTIMDGWEMIEEQLLEILKLEPDDVVRMVESCKQ